MSKLTQQAALGMHRAMCRIRYFEEAAAVKYKEGELPGFIHLSIGQEACAVGVCATLTPEDYITSTHRGHGHCLAKGGDAKRMMAELFAKEAGYSQGRGGSMHIADVAVGMLGANGIVGQSMPLGVGAALTAQVKGSGAVAVAFFGEGASGAGVAHEAMNMASLWRLPLVFFCEANRYAELTPYETHVPLANVADRAPAYDMPGVTIDGGDVVAVFETMEEAVARARAGHGPSLIEAKTYRWHGHYEGDPQKYKPEGETEKEKARDPIMRFEALLRESFGVAAAGLEAAHAEEKSAIEAAVAFAEQAVDPTPDGLTANVYA
ncbi:MAG: thiamine pyrophosphate-dependent dehydrogenase E1 component subunit alpha [Alphaproteobacteria bacterium]|jgi:pyruvate dehydrogenase E1 component alpha subunit|nr:thiamine pyrophosphate-dependent dehydrogenase E1 component subunit alpha [Alphaproteobacteria bacterium]MDP6589334.1 thiamine pyrophosphate-dependent dehydrogenase E1 component subunit alpha [Alphaproteobacteria bacterium]